MTISYPETKRQVVVDEYFGGKHKIEDAYRWLEDPDSEETKKWVEEQNKLTFGILDKITYREEVKNKLTKWIDYEKVGAPRKHGDKYYFYHNTGLQNQSVLYSQTSLTAPKEVFIDPNLFSEDGTVAISQTAFSYSGKYCAYMVSRSGSDWNTVRVRDTATLQDLEDKCDWVKFSGLSWAHDDRGFFYNRYAAEFDVMDNKAGTETTSASNQKVYYHALGTDSKEDILIFEDTAHPTRMYGAFVSDDGKYLFLSVREGCAPEKMVFWVEVEEALKTKGGLCKFNTLIDKFEFEYGYITNEGSVVYFVTTDHADKKRVIAVDLTNPAREQWKEVIPESQYPLQEVDIAGRTTLLLSYLVDVKDQIWVYSLAGEKQAVLDLPVGAVEAISTKKQYTEVFLKMTSFLFPGRIYRYDTETRLLTVHHDTVVAGFNPDEYAVEQVFYSSKDGTRVPMYIMYNNTMQRDGSNGCILYGYGGFRISLTPSFSAARIVWLRHFNGIYAIANIRGGLEYGEQWWKEGRLLKKQNCFDDFQAAAKHLIDNKYTTASRITINGGSNGGYLVGACMNQAPELFGAVVCSVGVLDLLRFHKFTIGHAWRSDYGDPDANEDDFNNNCKLSPFHNVRSDVTYPACMLCTGDHDDRVVPLHSFKFISELQHKAKPSDKPLVIRIDVNSGHGAGKPTTKRIEENADTFTFAALYTGLEWKS